MYGAIIGDIIGSTYEYEQIRSIKSINPEKLILDNSFFSDDTILTIAIIDAILSGEDYEYKLKEYGLKYLDYQPNFKPYFKSSFSPGFIKWLKGNYQGESTGNGAMMRIGPVGYLFDSDEDVKREARLATIPSHNSKEAIDSATIIALIIYYARNGMSKEQIINELNLKYSKNDFLKFNTTCSETIGNCLYVLFNSNSFEDAMLKTLKLGGDTDTNCCIVGSMAEAFYGIDQSLIKQVNEKIPSDFIRVLSLGYERINRRNNITRLNKNHWFIGNNEMSISLMRFYIKIEITKNNNNIFYRLKVYNDGKVSLTFDFYSLADAVCFTEEKIDKCYTIDEIVAIYQEEYEKECCKRLLKRKRN